MREDGVGAVLHGIDARQQPGHGAAGNPTAIQREPPGGFIQRRGQSGGGRPPGIFMREELLLEGIGRVERPEIRLRIRGHPDTADVQVLAVSRRRPAGGRIEGVSLAHLQIQVVGQIQRDQHLNHAAAFLRRARELALDQLHLFKNTGEKSQLDQIQARRGCERPGGRVELQIGRAQVARQAAQRQPDGRGGLLAQVGVRRPVLRGSDVAVPTADVTEDEIERPAIAALGGVGQ